MDKEDRAFYKRVRQAYLQMFVSSKDIYGDIKIIDGNKSIKEIINEIVEKIEEEK